MTLQRRVILEELRRSYSHPTADEVYGLVRQRLPKISLATVYRNLDILSAHGLIEKLELGGGQRRYDGETKNHGHIRCTGCGRVDDVTWGSDFHSTPLPARLNGYLVTGQLYELIGLCPACQSSGEKVQPQAAKSCHKDE